MMLATADLPGGLLPNLLPLFVATALAIVKRWVKFCEVPDDALFYRMDSQYGTQLWQKACAMAYCLRTDVLGEEQYIEPRHFNPDYWVMLPAESEE